MAAYGEFKYGLTSAPLPQLEPVGATSPSDTEDELRLVRAGVRGYPLGSLKRCIDTHICKQYSLQDLQTA